MHLLSWLVKKRIFFSLVIIVGVFSEAQAGQTVVAGGATIRQAYDSNIYRTNRDQVSEWTTALVPTMSIADSGQSHSLHFEYAPSVVYSHLSDNERWDHLLVGVVEKDLTERFSFSLRDTFVRAEDPYDDEEAGIELSDSRGRKRYWTNNATVALGYDYAEESLVKLTYANLVLDNDDSVGDDYVKHSTGIFIDHRLGQHWQTTMEYLFTKGNFDQDDDLENHAGDMYIFYHPSSSAKIFVHGGYTANRYVGLQEDYDVTRASLGFDRQVSSLFDLRCQVGTVSLSRDEGKDQDDFYYSISINQKLEHGAISFAGEGGIDEQHFDGTADQDLSRYVKFQAGFQYNLTENLLTNLKFSFREDEYWEREPEETEEELKAEASLSYSFGRWYTASLGYVFSRREADILSRCYDDNRVFLGLGFNKDFFRW